MLPPLFFSVRVPTLLAMLWRQYVRPGSITGISQKEPLSILVLRLDSLGDVVLTTPLFRELKKAYPQSRCTAVVQECYRGLLVTNPHVDQVLSPPDIKPAWLPRGAQRLLAAVLLYWTRLRRKHFDLVISPRWDVDEHLAAFLCVLTSASRRIGYSEKTSSAKRQNNRGFDTAFTTCLPPGQPRHEMLRNLAIVEALGASVTDCALEIRLTERDRRHASKLLAQVATSSKLIAVGIGANSPGRRWPLVRYSEILLRLAEEHPVEVVIVCSANEHADALGLANSLHGGALIVSGAPIREVCAVLERCDLFIGNDSGSAHLAAAMNCATIVISRHPADGDPNHFNSPVRFAPHGTWVRVLQPLTGLDGCKAGCTVQKPHCIESVMVDDVVAAARKMLRQSESSFIRPMSELRPDKASLRLLQSHAADAIQRAVESLQAEAKAPPAQA